MTKAFLLAALTATSLVPSASFAWNASNGLVVNATGSGTFTVPYRGASGPRAFWCAAGDYVVRELNLPGRTKVFRTSPVPRSAGQAMSFSLDRADSVGSTGLAVIGSPSGISASHARLQCDNRQFRY